MIKQKVWIVIFLFQFFSLKGQIITTIAGRYTQPNNGYSGDGGPATNALLWQPANICKDAKGNLYISESINNVIRKVDPLGIITTVAGTSAHGYSGDGGPAKTAELNIPSCVEMDYKGNLYIADTYNHVVRKVNTQGIITTFAGNGSQGYSGDGGLAISSQLNLPGGLAIDIFGNIFISDFGTNVIRKVDTSGMITAIAGDNTAGYSGDGGPALQAHIRNVCLMAFDRYGDLFFADRGNNVIRKINLQTDIIQTVAGSGVIGTYGNGVAATTAQFNGPYGLCFDPANNMYITDCQNNWVRKVDTNGIITTVAGTGVQGYSGDGGPPLQAQLGAPSGVMADSFGNLYIVEAANMTVRKISVCKKVQLLQPLSSIWGCEGSTITLPINANSVENYQWQWNDTSNSLWKDAEGYSYFSGASTGSLKIGPLNTAINHLRFRCMLSNHCSLDSTNPIQLNVYIKDTSIQISISNNRVCARQKVQFSVVPSDSFSYIHYRWQINEQSLQDSGSIFITNTLKDGDRIRCIKSNSSSCATSGTNLSNTITVRVVDALHPVFSIKASATEACSGVPITFKIKGTGLSDTASYQWMVNGIAQSITGSTFIDNHLQTAFLVNCVVSQSCFNDSLANGVTIKINPNPEVQITTLNPWIVIGESTQLQGSIKGNFSNFLWSPILNMSNSTGLTPTVYPTKSTTYYLEAVSDKRCRGKGSIIIGVSFPFNIPNAFTPNGDGKNDVFRIPPTIQVELLQFSIFDRWGGKVFETKNLNEGWDGTFQGMKYPVGAYVYLIKIRKENKIKAYKGTVNLIR